MMATQQRPLNPSLSNPDDILEYASIYDKPKRAKGRPSGSKYSKEEKLARNRQAHMHCYHINHEHYKTHQRLRKQELYHATRNQDEKTNMFVVSS